MIYNTRNRRNDTTESPTKIHHTIDTFIEAIREDINEVHIATFIKKNLKF